MQIQVRINEEGALRNQRFAFTDRFTLVSELLQNARRAGATSIGINHEAEAGTLAIRDNGRGIDDFQKLLTFNESGWDEPTCDAESPFGIGFSKCLYAASRCIVRSRGQCADFDTASALARTPIDVTESAEAPAEDTQIELHGVDLPDLGSRIATLCAGFPVPVCFNGKALERPDAADRLSLTATPIGGLHLCGTRDGEHSHDTLVYLQGFCVLRPIYHRPERVNVLHLDARQFMARLPDRDKLIDEDRQRKRIDTALRAEWRRVLEDAKRALPAEVFVDRFYPALRGWGHLDLLNDIDALPAAVFDEICGYPYQEGSGHRDYLRTVAVAPARAAIEAGSVKLCSIESIDENNAGRWMFARATGCLLFNLGGLHHEHWVQAHVRWLDDEPVTVEPLGERVRRTLEGRWIWPDVALCTAVRVGVGSDSVDLTDAGVHHDGVLYIPDGEWSGEPVRQVSNFTDENEQFLESDLDADRDALVDLIRRLRSVDPKDTLDSLLRELKLERYPVLHGRQFRLSVGTGSGGHAVELAD
jgi:hypothetical protein